MFVIKLLQTTGSRKGERHTIGHSPFVIGRQASCDLAFETRTISRKHCAIVFDENHVAIHDLGSRNGTLVDGENVPAEGATQLSHHSVIQIGKLSFRISVRDAETNRAFRHQLIDLSTVSGKRVDEPAGAEQLLSELDALASQLDARSAPNFPTSAGIDQRRSAEGVPRENAVSSTSQSVEGNAKAPSPNVDDDESTTMIPAQESGTVPEEDSQKGPQKIPDHLKPKGPKDSQDAAAAALNKLFVK